MKIDRNLKLYIAGHTGLVGSALTRYTKANGFNNLLLKSEGELDLTNQKQTLDFFQSERPDYVILTAAKVGGIITNGTPRKLVDITKLNKLGWHSKTSLEDGIKRTYEWYVKKDKLGFEN